MIVYPHNFNPCVQIDFYPIRNLRIISFINKINLHSKYRIPITFYSMHYFGLILIDSVIFVGSFRRNSSKPWNMLNPKKEEINHINK